MGSPKKKDSRALPRDEQFGVPGSYHKSAFGIVLFLARTTPPAHLVFRGEEYERLIRAHEERVAKEVEKVKEDCKGRAEKYGSAPRQVKFPGWAELKVVDCSRCGLTLLGRSHEWVRSRGSARRRSMLPPPVAGRVQDRPVCGGCLEKSQGKGVA